MASRQKRIPKPPRLTDDEKNAIGELIAAVELTGRQKRAPKLRAAVDLVHRLLEG